MWIIKINVKDRECTVYFLAPWMQKAVFVYEKGSMIIVSMFGKIFTCWLKWEVQVNYEKLTEWRRSINKQDIHNEMRLFLGDDYVKIDSGKWRILDRTRKFRVKWDDYLENYGIGQPTVPNTPHVHFEFLTPRSNGNGFDVIKNIHVPISD